MVVGLPEFEEDFRDQEKRTQAESLTLLSVGTFFTSITASILVVSIQQKSALYDVVNFFWFTSIVLSITSVMNSLLAFTWKQSILFVISFFLPGHVERHAIILLLTIAFMQPQKILRRTATSSTRDVESRQPVVLPRFVSFDIYHRVVFACVCYKSSTFSVLNLTHIDLTRVT